MTQLQIGLAPHLLFVLGIVIAFAPTPCAGSHGQVLATFDVSAYLPAGQTGFVSVAGDDLQFLALPLQARGLPGLCLQRAAGRSAYYVDGYAHLEILVLGEQSFEAAVAAFRKSLPTRMRSTRFHVHGAIAQRRVECPIPGQGGLPTRKLSYIIRPANGPNDPDSRGTAWVIDIGTFALVLTAHVFHHGPQWSESFVRQVSFSKTPPRFRRTGLRVAQFDLASTRFLEAGLPGSWLSALPTESDHTWTSNRKNVVSQVRVECSTQASPVADEVRLAMEQARKDGFGVDTSEVTFGPKSRRSTAQMLVCSSGDVETHRTVTVLFVPIGGHVWRLTLDSVGTERRCKAEQARLLKALLVTLHVREQRAL
ncbi:MAG: hypothetical protein AAF581_07860 [Planctomycetota bacterium]